jgi:hypothetical protein
VIQLKLTDLEMFKCRLTHEDSTRVQILAPFTIDTRVIRVGDTSTSITVGIEGTTNVVISYQDFKLYLIRFVSSFQPFRSLSYFVYRLSN